MPSRSFDAAVSLNGSLRRAGSRSRVRFLKLYLLFLGSPDSSSRHSRSSIISGIEILETLKSSSLQRGLEDSSTGEVNHADKASSPVICEANV